VKRWLVLAVLGLTLGAPAPALAAGPCATNEYHAEFFNNTWLGGNAVHTRCYTVINQEWGLSSPAPAVSVDNFSVRWTGQHYFADGYYTFRVTADDGIRVWLDDTLLLDAWRDQSPTTYTEGRHVSQGEHTVKVEYFERTTESVAKVLWTHEAGGGGGGGSVVPTSYFQTLAPGSSLPSGDECAGRVRRSSWEPRPENWTPNHTTPGGYRINRIDGADSRGQSLLAPRIDGNYTGTTDEIIRWASCKWGFDEDHIRAIAHTESSWYMTTAGDQGASKGLIQIKASVHDGTFPWSVQSTAFNLDYALAWKRAVFEGYMSDWVPPEARGDEWGATGLWCSGDWSSRWCGGYIPLIQYWVDNKPWLRYT